MAYFQVIRAKIVLLAADGWSNKEVGERLDVPRLVVSKWRKRWSPRTPVAIVPRTEAAVRAASTGSSSTSRPA